MPVTDFEGYSHEQLLAMIASLDPETVRARAAQLAKAAEAITEIGESLKRHRVAGWEGEAAHAYQDWVSRAGSATLLLGRYGEAAGTWMTHAAQTMVEVRANTPGYDREAAATLETTRHHPNDPDAARLARTAHTKLTADRHQAVQQLTKLAQSYDTSTTQLHRAQIPTFPPPPGVFEPKGIGSDEVSLSRGGGSSGGNYGVGGTAHDLSAPTAGVSYGEPGSVKRHASPSVERPLPGGSSLPPTPVPRPREVEMDLDHVATVPSSVVPSISVPSGASGHSAPSDTWKHPGQSLPPLAVQPMSGPLSPLQPFVGAGGSKVGGTPDPLSSGTGIVGGRPVSAGGGSGAFLPRGTVVGAEGTHASGRGMPGMTTGFGGPHGSPGTPAVGRRLAIEPGGVVGGRQASTGAQPFTQGGSGLVRGGSGAGAVGLGGAASPTPGRRRGGQGDACPDYLTEDEETWQSSRRVVPPVID